MKITPDLLQLLLEGGRDRDAVEHGIDRDAVARRCRLAVLAEFRFLAHDAEQRLALAQRDAELLVGLEDLGIDVVERLRRLEVARRGIIVGVLIVDRPVFDLGPLRLAHGEPAPIGVEPPLEHPGGLVLLGRDEADGVLRQALRGLVGRRSASRTHTCIGQHRSGGPDRRSLVRPAFNSSTAVSRTAGFVCRLWCSSRRGDHPVFRRRGQVSSP